MWTALTHVPSPHLERFASTFLERSPIDHALAVLQHDAYCELLRRHGVEVLTLDINRDYPDSVFVEDTAVVLDEIAILTPMGTESRRGEPGGIEPTLRWFREVRTISLPATLEGGDVLRIGKRLLVGLSQRTNAEGIIALHDLVAPLGYEVVPIRVSGCLHLKTACTALPDGRLLVNPSWIDVGPLEEYECVPVPEEEPWAANVLLLGERVCLAEAHPQTAEMVRGLGFEVETIDLSEFAKAEGGITCCSIVFRTAVN